MKLHSSLWSSLFHEESGQDLIEYALIACLIGLGAVASLKSLTLSVGNVFLAVNSTLTNAL